MSVYKNYVQDFPNRCKRVFMEAYKLVETRKLDVTFMISIAAVGINIPYERLMKDDHPSGDAEKYREASNNFKDACSGRFSDMESLSSNLQLDQWEVGKLDKNTALRPPDEWGGKLRDGPKAIGNKSTGSVLKIFRNALAHGNIYVPSQGEIGKIYFLSKVDYEGTIYEFISTTPDELKKFIVNWLSFLSKQEIYPEILDTEGEAA